MKTTTILAIALGLGSLAACNKSPQEQAAANYEANVDNAADTMEANVGNAADNMTATTDNAADAMKDAAGNKADAMKDAADNTFMSAMLGAPIAPLFRDHARSGPFLAKPRGCVRSRALTTQSGHIRPVRGPFLAPPQ